MARIELLPLTHIHAFTYSKRDGTPSAELKSDVRGDIAKARHKELTARIAEKNYAFRKAHSSELTVLLESGRDGRYTGYDQYYNKVTVSSNEDLQANWVKLCDVVVKKDGNYATI
jgi:tRNA A37 methylthiotransferase MiaB